MSRDRVVHIVAKSSAERAEQARACFSIGNHAEIYGSYEELIAAAPERGIVLAEDLPDDGGVCGLLAHMTDKGFWLPVLATAHQPEAGQVVKAIKGGALDYLPAPIDREQLARTLERAANEAEAFALVQRRACEAKTKLARLTLRESEVLDRLVAGLSNKCIARDLKISPRTVEIHRAHMMNKLGATHAADAVRMRLEAGMADSPVAMMRDVLPNAA